MKFTIGSNKASRFQNDVGLVTVKIAANFIRLPSPDLPSTQSHPLTPGPPLPRATKLPEPSHSSRPQSSGGYRPPGKMTHRCRLLSNAREKRWLHARSGWSRMLRAESAAYRIWSTHERQPGPALPRRFRSASPASPMVGSPHRRPG
ncbi:hypothetical protein BC938DRAFT_476835 [Jimgerdemannia flammicorona]|uniref:Uncharacterized protein n=1 Tax=Jimgerdemannia flammicorona TaxID=994334 RepID=A0A433QQ44_9FUNG|nr:hypothetical protein BC938DRAFT_476835 [Jimgerdemannia flammicorona]